MSRGLIIYEVGAVLEKIDSAKHRYTYGPEFDKIIVYRTFGPKAGLGTYIDAYDMTGQLHLGIWVSNNLYRRIA
jgi:hypothetical protein